MMTDTQIPLILLRRKSAIRKQSSRQAKIQYISSINLRYPKRSQMLTKRFGDLQQQNSGIGRVTILMNAMHDEAQIQLSLDLEKEKRLTKLSFTMKKKEAMNKSQI